MPDVCQINEGIKIEEGIGIINASTRMVGAFFLSRKLDTFFMSLVLISKKGTHEKDKKIIIQNPNKK